mmetsp:Transcript_34077/g.85842  ORF Transcript_34077/g.85842 Transcript_34077/m.85842 type:complete len:125 (+) Transcript_34077:218-592(+)
MSAAPHPTTATRMPPGSPPLLAPPSSLPVGLRDGLPIGVGSVDLVQLWVMMYHATCLPTWRRSMLLACYAVPQAAVQVGKMGRHFIGVVKTGHGLFPKAFLKSHLVHAQLGAQPGLLGAPPPLR